MIQDPLRCGAVSLGEQCGTSEESQRLNVYGSSVREEEEEEEEEEGEEEEEEEEEEDDYDDDDDDDDDENNYIMTGYIKLT